MRSNAVRLTVAKVISVEQRSQITLADETEVWHDINLC